MDWYIHHVNTPAVDVRRVAAFLQETTGMVHGSRWLYPEDGPDIRHNPDNIAFFGEECRGMHVCKPLADFAQRLGFMHNPTVGGHFAFNVNEIDAMKGRLEAAGVAYTDAGTFAIAGVVQIYFFDPSMNLIEVNQIIEPVGGTGPRAGETHDIHRENGDWYIHHVSLSVHDLDRSIAFFEDVVGIGSAQRLAGDWVQDIAVFGSDHRGLHLVEPLPGAAQALGTVHNPTVGGHYAITVPDLAAAKAKLDAAGTPYSTPSMTEFPGVEQIYVFDPEYRLVEINQVV